ncbi:hypothetical protein SDRG_08009 [Saprolegnia diclina VS20]|uniref:Uncharacterized protein n=1 Tax=Saprolegnia diclina (strain VS20) TaxID=1156394 RepID=T0RQ73_SAPDV|nr:hypothetical protein SDRG_08009 [Saprolegnia diclina VS20]EQC34693.1 hypothetical protein SDRG_08009 [Saprolegnia diclina VS20]|eukprot:XP_008612099.1 hypothetical protein SDRG_08009 [Saprolegnia diclina VS20]
MSVVRVGPRHSPSKRSLVPIFAPRSYVHVVGVAYVLASIALSFLALDVMSAAMTTNFFVPAVDASLSLLLQRLNDELTLPNQTSPRSVNVTTALLSDSGVVAAAYARRVVHEDLTHVPGSVADEIALWSRLGFSHFSLQFGNGFETGLAESVSIQNALGLRYAVSLKASPPRNRMPYASTLVFYNLFYNDLYAIAANASLVRNAPSFFGHTDPFAIETFVVQRPLTPISTITT